MKDVAVFFLSVLMLPKIQEVQAVEPETDRSKPMINIAKTLERLKAHLHVLTETIGERSVRFPENLSKTTDSAFFRNPHYHLPSDTIDALDYNFMAELVESLVFFLLTAERAD